MESIESPPDLTDEQSFADATNWNTKDGVRFDGEVAAAWGQGRAVYGGLVAGAMARAMRTHVADGKSMRSFSMTFAGPVEIGPVHCETRVLREGRTATFVASETIQGDQIRATATATYGADRASSITAARPPLPNASSPEDGALMPYLQGAMPHFTRRVEFRWTRGRFPFSGHDDPSFAGWFRFRQDDEPADEIGLLGLIDCWPAPALSLLHKPAPASSITWNVDFSALRPDAKMTDWWYFDATTSFLANGYTSFDASMWAQDGPLVARSRQLVGVFG